MQLRKPGMFMLLNGLIVLALGIYFVVWLSAKVTTARIVAPYQASKITAVYEVEGRTFKKTYMRHNVSFQDRFVSVRYRAGRPASSRVNSFMGIAAEPLAWWLVFLLASTMLFFTDNVVFSKHTVFRLHKKFPWISMDEYFPLTDCDRWYETEESKGKPRSQGNDKPALDRPDSA